MEARKDRFQLVGVSGCSGSAGVAAAMACGIPYAIVEAALKRFSGDAIFGLSGLATPNIIQWLRSGLKGPFTGFFRGKPYRDVLHQVLGDRTFEDCKIPLEIPAFNVSTGEVVVFVRGRHSLVKVSRASAAQPGAVEAESGVDVDHPEHHFVDAGLVDPFPFSFLDTVKYDRLLLQVNDAVKPYAMPDLLTAPWTFFRLVIQVLAGPYRLRMQEDSRAILKQAQDAGIPAQLALRTAHAPTFTWTPQDMLNTAEDAFRNVGAILDNPGILSGSRD